MTSRNEISATPERSCASHGARSGGRAPIRRRVGGVVASFAVVGFAAAIVAPTGMALADPPVADESISSFALASEETQNLTVASDAATFTPVERGTYEVYVTPPPAPEPAADEGSGSSGGGGPAPLYTGGGAPADWMAAAGIAPSDWGYVDYIVSRESGWNPNAVNRSSGASGLVQALPCSKVPGNCFDPVDNLRWANGYAIGRYGSWAGAYAFWSSNHWW